MPMYFVEKDGFFFYILGGNRPVVKNESLLACLGITGGTGAATGSSFILSDCLMSADADLTLSGFFIGLASH